MAEIFRKKTEDTYDTESIKKSLEKNEKKKKEKVVKTEKKKETKKGFFAGIKNFFDSVGAEFKRVHWPSNKDMVKYSIATIFFILFFGIFFTIIDIIVGLVLKYF